MFLLSLNRASLLPYYLLVFFLDLDTLPSGAFLCLQHHALISKASLKQAITNRFVGLSLGCILLTDLWEMLFRLLKYMSDCNNKLELTGDNSVAPNTIIHYKQPLQGKNCSLTYSGCLLSDGISALIILHLPYL